MPMELAGRFYTLELLPGHSLCSFGAVPLVLPGGEAEASAVVAPALASSITCHLRPQAPCSSMCLWHQSLKASVPAGLPGAMSNDPPPPYPGGPSAPLIEEKHGPPSAPGTGGCPSCSGVTLPIRQDPRQCGFPGTALAVASPHSTLGRVVQCLAPSVPMSPLGKAGGVLGAVTRAGSTPSSKPGTAPCCGVNLGFLWPRGWGLRGCPPPLVSLPCWG